jgi:hypothetical protein
VRASARPPAAGRAVARLRRVRDVWQLDYEGRSICLQDALGLRHLATLLARPGTPVASVARAAADGGGGRDVRAADLPAQRERVEELREELAEARAYNDPERVARASAELEQVAGELSPPGEARGPLVERARVNVTRAIRAALRRIGEHEPELGHLLQSAIRTGTACAYQPDPDTAPEWEIRA